MSEYGLLVSLGIFLASALLFRLAPRVGVTATRFMDVIFWSVLAGMVGARVLYVLLNLDFFVGLCVAPDAVLPEGLACLGGGTCLPGQECDGLFCRNIGDCLAALKVWQGGWVYLGGFLGGLLGALVSMKALKIAWSRGLALLGTALPLGHAVGRLGCYVRGCCYGKGFAHWVALEGIHPVQLYESGLNLLLFAILLSRFFRITRDHKRLSELQLWGQSFLYVGAYGAIRFVTELFRGDEERGFLFRLELPGLADFLGMEGRSPMILSTSQLISLGMIAVSMVAWVVNSRRGTGDVGQERSLHKPGGNSVTD